MTRARGALVVLPLLLALACAAPPRSSRTRPAKKPAAAETTAPLPAAAPPFHLASVVDDGDATRRASMRLVMQGLDADAASRPDEALRLYERALQVDAMNPWAYLALARFHAENDSPARALQYVDKADALLGARASRMPGLDAHLSGLRGVALRDAGRTQEAAPLLAKARALAPGAWSDGRLDADELR